MSNLDDRLRKAAMAVHNAADHAVPRPITKEATAMWRKPAMAFGGALIAVALVLGLASLVRQPPAETPMAAVTTTTTILDTPAGPAPPTTTTRAPTTTASPEPTTTTAGSPTGGEADSGGLSGAIPAPPPDSGPITLWLSERRIPVGGADLVAVLRNAGLDEAIFGVGAAIDRWTDGGWAPFGTAVMCLDFWNCLGTITAEGETPFVRLIGLPVAPGGIGRTEWLRVEGLEPGWYRLRQIANEGFEATGTFEVVDRKIDLVPVGDVSEVRLSVYPALLSPDGGAATIALLGGVGGDETPAGDSSDQLTPSAELQHWAGDDWETLATVPVTPAPPGHPHAGVVEVPALSPGAYRVVRFLPDGKAVPGLFWVTT